jgi:hypothetical protein
VFHACLFLLFAMAAKVDAAERVEIRFNIPPGLEEYSGRQPVTFGVPFQQGVLEADHGLRIVDASGDAVPGQFEVAATWTADGNDVRWLLIDCLADIRSGVAQPAFLEFGPDVPEAAIETDLKVEHADDGFRVTAGGRTYSVRPGDPELLGGFILTDGKGKQYRAGGMGNRFELVAERIGPLRAVIKVAGDYVAEDGTSVAEFVTRARFYAGCPFVRIFHTMIWQTDAGTQIGSLAFRPDDSLVGGRAVAGVDGLRSESAAELSLKQTAWNKVEGTVQGKRLDGWIEVSNDKRSRFAALRWPWQQFPVGLAAAQGQLEVRLVGPRKPMSLKAEDVAVDYVVGQKDTWNLRIFQDGDLWDMQYNGPAALPHISPRGVARTYELLLWTDDRATRPEIKNIFAQHPVLGYAEPAFAARAALPSPMSPRNTERFPVIEAALERAFDWIARENAFDGDFGTWNYGDIQWAWVGRRGYTTYRYWMNHGKGWSIVPWLLWLRSGDRKYFENGEANSRHCMDVDLCHVPEWERTADGKIRGGQYHYSAIHWGYGPEVASFFVDSEYLPYCYYVTGYERAKDVMLQRAEALARDPWRRRVQHFRENREARSRHLYIMVKELAAFYEATWRRDLGDALEAYLDLTLDAQMPSGNFYNIKNNHYLAQPLNLAARVLPERRPRILSALERWRDYQGDALQARPGSSAAGPVSLWSLASLSDAADAGQARALRAYGVQTARAQAWCVSNAEDLWRGYAPYNAHLAGPILRDWVIATSALPHDTGVDGLAPLLHFNARLPLQPGQRVASRDGQHVVLALKELEKPLEVSLHLSLHNLGNEREHLLKVYRPDAREIDRRTFITDSGNNNLHATQGVSFEIPAAEPAGVYVLIIRTIAPVGAQASSDKLVHYMPPGRRTFCSAVWGGQAWFEPLGTEEIVIGDPSGFPCGEVTVFCPDGVPVAASRITGTAELDTPLGRRQIPTATPCRFQPELGKKGLYSFVCANVDWHGAREIRGMKPWFAARRREWFDPTRHACPDLDQLLANSGSADPLGAAKK